MWTFVSTPQDCNMWKQNIAVVINSITIKECGYFLANYKILSCESKTLLLIQLPKKCCYFLATLHDSIMWKQQNIAIHSIAMKQCGYFLGTPHEL